MTGFGHQLSTEARKMGVGRLSALRPEYRVDDAAINPT